MVQECGHVYWGMRCCHSMRLLYLSGTAPETDEALPI